MTVKMGGGGNFVEQTAMRARLEQLGLKGKDGQALGPGVEIDEASMANVAGGAEAIQALVGTDGNLGLDAIGKLRQDASWFGKLIGRDLPIDKKQTQAVQALSMELDGVTGAVANAAKNPGGDLAPVERRVQHFAAQLEKLLIGDTASLAQADPDAVKQLGFKVMVSTERAVNLMDKLSEQRAAGTDAKADKELELADVLVGTFATVTQAVTNGPQLEMPSGVSPFTDALRAQALAESGNSSAVAGQLATSKRDDALPIAAGSDLAQALVDGAKARVKPFNDLAAKVKTDSSSAPLSRANAAIQYAADTLGNPNIKLDSATKGELQAVFADVIEGAQAEYNRRIDFIEHTLSITDTSNDKYFHWTNLIAKSPGSDWGFYGAAEVTAEKKCAMNNLGYAKENLAYLAKPLVQLRQVAELAGVSANKLPKPSKMESLLKQIDANGRAVGGKVSGIMAGQLEGMMQVQNLGGSTALSGDDIKSMYS